MSKPTCTQATKKPSPCFQHYVGVADMIHYDGALGYEAFICRQCGVYFDYTEGEHPADQWSLSFITRPRTNNQRKEIQPCDKITK